MYTIKNTFKKFPLTSLITTHFVVVWLVPLFVIGGVSIKAFFFAIIFFWMSVPYLFYMYSDFPAVVNTVYSFIFENKSYAVADPIGLYVTTLAPLFVFFTMLIKKKFTGTLTPKDIFLLFIFCSVLPLMYAAVYIYIWSFSGANFIL